MKMIGRLAGMIAWPSPPPQRHLFDLRRELASTLIGHLKAEDWVLYPRLLASPDSHIAALTKRISRENRELCPMLESLDRAA